MFNQASLVRTHAPGGEGPEGGQAVRTDPIKMGWHSKLIAYNYIGTRNWMVIARELFRQLRTGGKAYVG